MTSELFTIEGKRKYLTQEEQGRFMAAANAQERAEVRTFSLTFVYTGCRISEALELTPERADLSDKSITFRTLKQRDKIKYRSVPCPDTLLDAIELVHSARKARRSTKLKKMALWSWGRTQATKHVWAVMEDADISGDHASPKAYVMGSGFAWSCRPEIHALYKNYGGIPILRRPQSIWIWSVMRPEQK